MAALTSKPSITLGQELLRDAEIMRGTSRAENTLDLAKLLDPGRSVAVSPGDYAGIMVEAGNISRREREGQTSQWCPTPGEEASLQITGLANRTEEHILEATLPDRNRIFEVSGRRSAKTQDDIRWDHFPKDLGREKNVLR